MPLYHYYCEVCKTTYEAVKEERLKDTAICPVCVIRRPLPADFRNEPLVSTSQIEGTK